MMKPLAERILAAERILMTTHRDPDGDGIGSILALAGALRRTGKQIDTVLPDPCPNRFRFLDEDRLLRDLPCDAVEIGSPQPDFVLVIDTHQWAQIGRLGELICEAAIPTLFLDHHPVRGNDRDDVYGDPNASSTGELVYRLLLHYLDMPIDERIGGCIYASIAFDTHSFRYVRNSPSPHLIAADLLSRGVDANQIYRHLFASNPVGKMRLLGRLMSAVQIEENGELAWVGLPQAWIHEYGVADDDIRDAVNCLLELEGIEVAVLLKEIDKESVKVSLRSKGRIEMHEVARELGGGGHCFAAGVTLTGSLEASKSRVLERVVPLLRGGDPSP